MRVARFFAVVVALIGGLVAVTERPAAAAPAAVCGPAPAGHARCFATLGADAEIGTSQAGVAGYGPAQIKQAYGFPTGLAAGAGQTIALVSAFDAPTIQADLGVFSRKFGLPACTTANGCFTKIYARGVAPTVDPGWALESTLDVEWAHAIAPGAKILLIEASSNAFGDLFQAFDVGLQSDAKYISSSWGALEFSGQTIFDPLLDNPGVSDFFGSGDNGAGGLFPASSPEVIAVGGTRLVYNPQKNKNRETGWSGSGGGCSQYYDAGTVQSAFAQYPSSCAGKRAFPDLAAVADSDPGLAVFDSTEVSGQSGWLTVGGTSAATPIMAARAAVTGVVWDAAYVYSASRQYRDIIAGFNGFPTGPGFDLVTGRGRYRS
ncbi:MAG: hypothetical protein QOI61_883 [Actinomycetota bacterium]